MACSCASFSFSSTFLRLCFLVLIVVLQSPAHSTTIMDAFYGTFSCKIILSIRCCCFGSAMFCFVLCAGFCTHTCKVFGKNAYSLEFDYDGFRECIEDESSKNGGRMMTTGKLNNYIYELRSTLGVSQ